MAQGGIPLNRLKSSVVLALALSILAGCFVTGCGSKPQSDIAHDTSMATKKQDR